MSVFKAALERADTEEVVHLLPGLKRDRERCEGPLPDVPSLEDNRFLDGRSDREAGQVRTEILVA